MVWAHSVNDDGERHRLNDHLRGTAMLARGFASPFGLGDVAWWCGLVHDGGKAWCDWQRGLLKAEQAGGRVGIDHKSYGVQLARQNRLVPVEWAVAGHHGGLTRSDTVDGLVEDDPAARSVQWADADRVLRDLVPEIFTQVPDLPDDFAAGRDRLVGEFVLRFLFSCLVDADALDTRAHRLALQGPELGPDLDAAALLERLLRRRSDYLDGRRWTHGPMAALRETVFAAALAAADAQPGLFRLTAPTGAAKTIAAAGFALAHAARHHKRRVIVAVPFITITEQNAAVYRELLNPETATAPVVLEHHSHVNLDPDGDIRSGSIWQRLAAENWDAPFVVTTTVQLFESLFGRKPSRMRKLHRMANSVIVLDEVQALPHRLLPQIADALRILSSRFGATVLLSSATQPELWKLGPLRGLEVREVLPDAVSVFANAKRVRYQWMVDPKPSLATVVDDAARHPRVLMVLNTVRDARRAFQQARQVLAPEVILLHLSTTMCAKHRHVVLQQLAGLSANSRVFVVSTSLIEAGVDLDFPTVYRAISPPESQAQAAGRCNREGLLGAEGGLVVVFDPVDGGFPPSYQTQIEKARTHFGPGKKDPDDVDALSRYFEDLYSTLGIEDQGSVSATIRANRRLWDFEAVADGPFRRGDTTQRDRSKAFRMIVDDTVPVVVRYGDANDQDIITQTLTALRGPTPDRSALRRLQPYLTTIRRVTAMRPDVRANLTEVIGDLVEWRGDYNDGFGMVLEPEGEDYIL